MYDVTASGGNLAGLNATVTLGFAGGQNIADLADNALSNTAPTGTDESAYVIDNTAPGVTISDVPARSSSAFTARFSFSEPVTGFVVGDISVGNGAAGSFTPVTADQVWTAEITPSAEGEVTIDVAAAAATDAAGNPSTAATQATSVYDTSAPGVASIVHQTPGSSPTNADSVTWRVTFSKDVKNVDAADFTVSGTTAQLNFSEVTASLVYDVTASGGNLAGLNATVTLGFAGGQNIADLADNALSNTAPTGTDESAYVIDNTAPGVTISDVPARSSSAFTARFSFSEPVTGFVVGDISVGNGAAGSFTPVTADQVWTAEITPSAEGEVTIDVAAAAATDAAGNPSTAATQATSVYDTSAPGVASIVHQTPGSSPTNADSVTWRVTFSKDVKNVDAADFTVSGTTAQLNFSEVTASRVYDVTASGGNLAGLNATVTLGFAGGQNIADLADNALSDTAPTGTDESAYVIDNTAPGVTISDVPARSSSAFTARFSFSEPVTGFVVGDISVGNGAAGSFTPVTAGRVWTAEITPSAEGEVTIDVAASAATDAAGNPSTAATQATSVYDTSAPGVASIVHQTPGSSPTNADSVTWRVTFSKDVKNVDAADFTVSNTTAQLNFSEVTASRVYDVTASGGNLAGLNATVTLGFAGGQNIADLADNALSNTAPTGTDESAYVIDNTAPGVASIVHQTPGSSPTNADSVTWRVTFSEDVKNVNAADFTVSNTTAQLSVSQVTASRVYDVTASGGNLAGLNATVTLGFAGGQMILTVASAPSSSGPPMASACPGISAAIPSGSPSTSGSRCCRG